MWFLPLGRSLDDWFTAFLVKLLEADPATLRLLARDPFDGERPLWVRAVSYRYRFTTRAAAARGSRAMDPRSAARGARTASPAGVTDDWDNGSSEASRRRPRRRTRRLSR